MEGCELNPTDSESGRAGLRTCALRDTHTLTTYMWWSSIPTASLSYRSQFTSRPQSQFHRLSHEAEQKAARAGLMLSDDTYFRSE